MSSSSHSSSQESNTIQPYRMHVSQKYIDLTKKKLELTRLPREPRNAHQRYDIGVAKSDLEPLIDHWVESYDWRAQEAFYNDALPQYRVPINGTRLHFIHKRAASPAALPLLFVHGWPESFISASKVIDALSNPIATPPRGDEDTISFHVVVPSIPGFGFSDPIPEAGNNMHATAEVFNTLMMGLGYHHYICHGTGWGFKICRILAQTHPANCLAIHTVNPDVPAPRFRVSPSTWLKYMFAELTFATTRRSAFGYTPEELVMSGASVDSMQIALGVTPPLTPGGTTPSVERPQTTAYALSDSPAGLLAYILDSIRPPSTKSAKSSPTRSPESLRVPTPGRSPISPQTYSPQSSRSPHSPLSGYTPQHLELNDLSSPWSATAIINWCMLYWLPGPEVALRWLANSTAMIPSLWTTYSNVPLGITHFQEPPTPGTPGSMTMQNPSQLAESFHRIAMVRRREGSVRFPAWERPAELVMDIREFCGILGLTVPSMPVTNGH